VTDKVFSLSLSVAENNLALNASIFLFVPGVGSASALLGSSAAFGKLVVGDTEKRGKVVREANIKSD
jgi:hypothetical protein